MFYYASSNNYITTCLQLAVFQDLSSWDEKQIKISWKKYLQIVMFVNGSSNENSRKYYDRWNLFSRLPSK